MFIASTTLFAFLAYQAKAIPARVSSSTVDPLSIGLPVTAANSSTLASTEDLIKAQSLSADEYKYYHGWDGKVLEPSAIGTPVDTNTTLSARALGGVYFCENADWGQPCGYAVQPLNTCINLGPDWNDKISTIGPDPGTKLTVYEHANCQGASTPVQWPGGTAHPSWNDRPSSFRVFADPETEPRGVFICEHANWGQPCGYAKQPVRTCITLGPDWNDKISSIGPDPGATLHVFANSNCDYGGPGGYAVINSPGLATMSAAWNDAISSFMVIVY